MDSSAARSLDTLLAWGPYGSVWRELERENEHLGALLFYDIFAMEWVEARKHRCFECLMPLVIRRVAAGPGGDTAAYLIQYDDEGRPASAHRYQLGFLRPLEEGVDAFYRVALRNVVEAIRLGSGLRTFDDALNAFYGEALAYAGELQRRGRPSGYEGIPLMAAEVCGFRGAAAAENRMQVAERADRLLSFLQSTL